jgi:hypothetical protein
MITVYTKDVAHSDGSFFLVDLYVTAAIGWEGGTDGTINGVPYICHVALGGKNEAFATYNLKGEKVHPQDIKDYMSILFDCDPKNVMITDNINMASAAAVIAA